VAQEAQVQLFVFTLTAMRRIALNTPLLQRYLNKLILAPGFSHIVSNIFIRPIESEVKEFYFSKEYTELVEFYVSKLFTLSTVTSRTTEDIC
jgi:hypothetical protein